jgi:hypothetical protein
MRIFSIAMCVHVAFVFRQRHVGPCSSLHCRQRGKSAMQNCLILSPIITPRKLDGASVTLPVARATPLRGRESSLQEKFRVRSGAKATEIPSEAWTKLFPHAENRVFGFPTEITVAYRADDPSNERDWDLQLFSPPLTYSRFWTNLGPPTRLEDTTTTSAAPIWRASREFTDGSQYTP